MRCAIPSLLLTFSAITAVLVSAGDVTATEGFLREQVRLHPAIFQSHHTFAEFYIQQHKLTAAIPCLEAARQIHPSNYANGYDLALAYLQMGTTAKSREVITALLDQ